MSNPFEDACALIDDLEKEKSTLSVAEFMNRMEHVLSEVVSAFETRVSSLESRVDTHEQNYP